MGANVFIITTPWHVVMMKKYYTSLMGVSAREKTRVHLLEKAKLSGRYFQLRPFTSTVPLVEKLSLAGSLARAEGRLTIEYVLQGPMAGIHRAEMSSASSRCDALWRHTCFEFFFARKDESSYWEVNVNLSGCWNVYRFDDYRTGMREEQTVVQPLCRIVTENNLLSLICTMDLIGIVDDSSELEVGISSVIEASDGSISYWALEHYGQNPDFHDRRSFGVLLPGLKEAPRCKDPIQ
ncbi:MAG: DOMON-like domain-containing protein [Desulforhopalus sp.]